MSSIQKTRFNDITFDRLLGIRGVSGAMLTEAGKRTLSRTKLAETEAGRLSYLARHLCRGYRKVRRIPNRILIAYEKSALLIVSRDDAQLVMILESFRGHRYRERRGLGVYEQTDEPPAAVACAKAGGGEVGVGLQRLRQRNRAKVKLCVLLAASGWHRHAGHRHGGNALTSAHEAEVLVGGRFDAHLGGGDP